MRIMSMRILCLKPLMICLFLMMPFLAGGHTPHIVQYGVSDGFPQNSANNIVFDNAGYCWISTEVGLCRFDGRKIVVFDSRNIPGFAFSRLLRLAADKEGILYAASDHNQFLRIECDGLHAPQPHLLTHKEMLLPTHGYAAPHNTDLVALERAHNWFRDNLAVMPDETAYYLSCNKNSYLLYSVNGRHESRIDSIICRRKPRQLIVNDSLFLLLGDAGEAHAYVHGHKACVLHISGDIAHDTAHISGNEKTYCNKSGSFIRCGKNIYSVTAGNACHVFSEKIFSGVEDRYITSVYYNKSSSQLLLGTPTNGMYVVNTPLFRTQQIPGEPARLAYYQQIKAGGSIFSYNLLFGRGKPAASTGTQAYVSGYFNEDSAGFYYQEARGDIYRYNVKEGENIFTGSIGQQIRGTAARQDSIMLFTKDSIYVLHKGHVFPFCRTAFPGNRDINSIRQVSTDTLLYLTKTGLNWYSLKTHRVYRSALTDKSVTSCYEDSSKRLWVTTYGPDIYLLEKDSVFVLNGCLNHALHVPHCFIPDGTGYFLVPTNSGIYKICINDLVQYAHGKMQCVFSYKYGKLDGLACEEFNGTLFGNSYAWLQDSLSVSSLTGPVWLHPRSLPFKHTGYGIFLEEIIVDNKPSNQREGLSLSPDFQSVSFSVSSPYYGLPENILLQYRMQGLENSWKPVPINGLISFNRLPAGDYTLFVRKHIGQGDRFIQIAIPFTVQPWFYKTWWFLLFCAAMIAVAAYLWGMNRAERLKKRARQLEAEVAARTQDLQETIGQLEVSEQELAVSNFVQKQIMTMVLHDLRSPLSFLTKTSKDLYDNYTTADKSERGKAIQVLYNSILSLKNFTDRFFSWAMVHDGNFKIHKTYFPLEDIIDEIRNIYASLLQERGNHLVAMPSDITCYSDYNLLHAIIRNLMDNANKNCINGVITIRQYQKDDAIAIEVSDTGRGLSAEETDYFLGRKKNLAKNTAGSRIILDMVEKIEGTLDVSSTVGKGSTFIVTIPVTGTNH